MAYSPRDSSAFDEEWKFVALLSLKWDAGRENQRVTYLHRGFNSVTNDSGIRTVETVLSSRRSFTGLKPRC
jgi:hypothetical protein